MESKSGEATLQTWIEYHGLTSLTLEHAARLEVLMLTTEKQAYANGFEAGYSAGQADAVEKPNKVIQIALAAYQGMGLVALCEDGSLWFTERPYDIKMTWAQLPPPQDPK